MPGVTLRFIRLEFRDGRTCRSPPAARCCCDPSPIILDTAASRRASASAGAMHRLAFISRSMKDFSAARSGRVASRPIRTRRPDADGRANGARRSSAALGPRGAPAAAGPAAGHRVRARAGVVPAAGLDAGPRPRARRSSVVRSLSGRPFKRSRRSQRRAAELRCIAIAPGARRSGCLAHACRGCRRDRTSSVKQRACTICGARKSASKRSGGRALTIGVAEPPTRAGRERRLAPSSRHLRRAPRTDAERPPACLRSPF